MNKKLTTLLFGLLLTVGWTNSTQAQLNTEQDCAVWEESFSNRSVKIDPKNSLLTIHQQGPAASASAPMRAPLRTPNTITADETRTHDWWSSKTYTWYPSLSSSASPQTANFTDVATNPYQMAYLVSSIYTNPLYPGIQYDEVYQRATPYPAIGYGWGITGTHGDIHIVLSNQYASIRSITVTTGDESYTFTSWSYSDNGTSLPSTWSVTGNRTFRTEYNSTAGYTYCYFNYSSPTTITIPASLLTATNVDNTTIKVVVRAIMRSSGSAATITVDETNVTPSSWDMVSTSGRVYSKTMTATVTPPDYNGYTVLLVKVKSDATDFPSYTTNATALIDSCFSKYESIELLTDGLRVGENTSNAGTVFSYTGMLNRFFFISKGKTAQWSAHAPFYEMYEEFSPTTTATGDEITDFYANMTAGEYYPIVHDCQSVSQMEHYFSMTGKTGTEEKSLSSLVLYIPDDRSTSPKDSTDGNTYNIRNYDHQPQVGLYTIHLAAETAPVASYSESNRQYDVFLDWTSSLNKMVNNTVPQTYIIYKVTFDEHGNRVYTYLDQVQDVTTYSYPEDQLQTSQTFTYVILGYPTNATNKPVINAQGKVEGGQFYTYSNIDDVQIPGWFDFMVLYRERYESDFKVDEEKNYYRNYLYPTNLAPGTGMTMGQLKQEWPNQTASYTLWRDNRGIAKLEVRAIGNKVYYRIRYYEGSQVTNWRNDIEMPYPYVEIPNENN